MLIRKGVVGKITEERWTGDKFSRRLVPSWGSPSTGAPRLPGLTIFIRPMRRTSGRRVWSRKCHRSWSAVTPSCAPLLGDVVCALPGWVS